MIFQALICTASIFFLQLFRFLSEEPSDKHIFTSVLKWLCGEEVWYKKVREQEELQHTTSSQSLHDQYQNNHTDAAKWNSANINYITRISAFHTVEAFV